MADIESMFHLVRVPDPDSLHFSGFCGGQVATYHAHRENIRWQFICLALYRLLPVQILPSGKRPKITLAISPLTWQALSNETYSLTTVLNRCHQSMKLSRMSVSNAVYRSEVVFDWRNGSVAAVKFYRVFLRKNVLKESKSYQLIERALGVHWMVETGRDQRIWFRTARKSVIRRSHNCVWLITTTEFIVPSSKGSHVSFLLNKSLFLVWSFRRKCLGPVG